MVRKRM